MNRSWLRPWECLAEGPEQWADLRGREIERSRGRSFTECLVCLAPCCGPYISSGVCPCCREAVVIGLTNEQTEAGLLWGHVL